MQNFLLAREFVRYLFAVVHHSHTILPLCESQIGVTILFWKTIQIHEVLFSVTVGLSEAFYVDFWLAILAEYLATLFFLFAVSGSSLRWEGAPTIFQQALAAGLCTASSIQAFRSVSLPLVHANPAVSVAAFITGDAGLLRMVCSVVAQMFGGGIVYMFVFWLSAS